MKIDARGLVAIAGSMVLCLALPAFGQSVSVTLSSVAGDPIVNVGGLSVYAGVYGGTATPLAGANAGIVCDDFNDEVGVPSTWGATAYQVSTLGASNPITDVLFGGSNTGKGYKDVGVAGYAEIAYLVNLMFNTTDTTKQGDISEAIWSITTSPPLTGVDAAALKLVTDANTYASSNSDSLSQYSNLYVLTPSTIGTGQEMWISVAEGGGTLLYLLLAGAACFGAMRFRSRIEFGKCEAA